MDTKDWIALVSLLVSFTSLIISFQVALKSHERAIYDTVDDAIEDLLRVQLEHPEYRSKELTDALLDKPANDPERLRVEAYIIMAYNTLETLYDKYGERKLRTTSFMPAMQALAQRHRKWLYIDDHFKAYNRGMISLFHAD